MHHAIGDYYLIPRQASDEPAYPLTGIMVKKRNKDSSGNECWRTGKLSKSALEETGAKSYMCLEIKRVH